MTERELMCQATDHILARMRTEGFWADYKHTVRAFENPTPWHINNGWCRAWTRRVRYLIPDAHERTLLNGRGDGHTFVELHGKFYDAQNLDGVDDPRKLPFFSIDNQLVQG